MKLYRKISSFGLVIAAIFCSQIATSSELSDTTITAQINRSGVITVTHPEALEMRLRKMTVADGDSASQVAKTGRVKKMGGYRVQIYSDNNARTAKNQARVRERAISQAFPELSTYVMFDSPYWRLRVGDCRTREEADELAVELQKAFPAYRAEIMVVRDRINASL